MLSNSARASGRRPRAASASINQNVQITKATLEHFGYTTISAADGSRGIAVYKERPGEIDLVLTDMSMPEMDGPTMIKELRSFDPNIKIVGMSGLMNAEQTAELDSLQVGAFLTKPFTTEKLLNTIAEVLSEA